MYSRISNDLVAGRVQAQQILGEQDAEDLIAVLADDREARMPDSTTSATSGPAARRARRTPFASAAP
jgi:hypothetical protein